MRIKLPIKLELEDNLSGKGVQYRNSTLRVKTSDIVCYHDTEDIEFPDLECIRVHLINGTAMTVYIAAEELDELLEREDAEDRFYLPGEPPSLS